MIFFLLMSLIDIPPEEEEQSQDRSWWQSATKLVLIGMSGAVIAGLFTGHIDPKDFVNLTGIVFAFYFGQKNLSEKK